MPQFTSALDLYRHQVAAFQRTNASARQAWRQIPEGGYRDLKELTSGGISSATLRRMGHPYARGLRGVRRGISSAYQRRNNLRSAKGVAPLLPINRQQGRLNAAVTLWHRSTPYRLEESVGFDSGKAGPSIYAVNPRGTRYVVPRGIWIELRRRGMARQKAFGDVFPDLQRKAFLTP